MKKTYLTETTIAFVVVMASMYVCTWYSAETVADKIQVLSAMGAVGATLFLGGSARKVGEKFADKPTPPKVDRYESFDPT